MGRSNKALKNVTTGLLNKLILMLLAFITRTLFIRLLGAEYTGISSLYTNILSVLSLAELGIGNVLMFYLYGALQSDDKEEIKALVSEFRKIYIGIIVAVLTIGCVLIPFLHYIINSNLNDRDLIIYYVLYLINSVASYFVVYRTMVLSADQKSYISNICSTATTIAMYICQIGYLLLFREFLGFLLIQVTCTISNNLILNYIAKKQYPFLKENTTKELNLNRKDIFFNIKATFLYKVADTILDQTDSVIISIMFGTVFVGYYSNYYLIITYLVNIAGIIANSLVASFGNLNAEGNKEKTYEMFKVAMLLFSAGGILCTNCYANLIQDFIPIWVGSEYLMNYSVVVAILAVFYLRMVTNAMWMYRSALGLFKDVQYINVMAAVLNIIFSICLGNIFGIAGVIGATALSRLITSFWFEGKILFNKFDKPVAIYYLQQLKDFILMLMIVGVSFCITSRISVQGLLGFVEKIIVCITITIVVEFLAYHNRPEFSILLNKVKSGLTRR